MHKPILVPPVVEVLGNRPFLTLWLSQAISQIAINMMNFVLLLYISQITKSNTVTSLFIIAISLPAVFFGSIAGVYVNYWSKKQVLFICNLLRVVILLLFFFSLDSLWWIFSLAIAASIVTQFFVPAEAPMIPELVKQKHLLAANSLFTVTFYLSVITGFTLAGPFIAFWGIGYVLLFLSLLFVLSMFLVSRLPGQDSFKELRKYLGLKFLSNVSLPKNISTTFLIDLKDGARYVKYHPDIIDALIMLTGTQVLISVIAAIAPGYATTVLHISVTDSSIYVVAPAVFGMVFGSILIGFFQKADKKRLSDYCIVLGGIFMLLLSFLSRGKFRNQINFNYLIKVDILFLAVSIFFFLGILNSLITVIGSTILQEKTDNKIRSRIYGFMTTGGGLASIVPVFLAGVFSDAFGVVKVMFVLGLVLLVFGAFRIAKIVRFD